MLDNEVYIHKMEIVDEERVDKEYVKHDIAPGYRTIPLTKRCKRF